MSSALRYFVEIDEGGAQGRLHQGNPAYAHPLPHLQLHPQAEVQIKGKPYSLGVLMQALTGYHPEDLRVAYDERGQLELGQYLHQQVFGPLSSAERQRLQHGQVELQIVTRDEHVARLPWALLANDGVFLTTAGWSVTLAHRPEEPACELPPSPRMLVVAPQPVGEQETKASSHLEKLEELLSDADPRHTWGSNLRKAATWEEFTRIVQEFRPEVVYYYGHGVGDRHTSRLMFATDKEHRRVDIPIADVAACLRQAPGGPPQIAYLNCCQGDAGGFLGAGWQLGNAIPAVVTNRTVAAIDAAQAQGLSFWRKVLIDGLTPHRAVTEMTTAFVEHGLTLKDTRWMTPVLHRHYAAWRAHPPQPQNLLDRSPHWRLKLDRVNQFSLVVYPTSSMLRERRPRTLAYVWYGEEGQGIDLFHQRLTVELRELMPDVFLYEVQPAWPLEFSRPDRSFRDMLTEAFGVNALNDIPARIRAENRGAAGRQTLVHIRHLPMRSKLVTPDTFKTYLEWWDKNFAPLLQEQVFALLGVSFVVTKPKNFLEIFTNKGVASLPLKHTEFQLLQEMEKLAKTDLLRFLNTHNIPVPEQSINRVLDEILARTGGHYEMTLEALKDVADRAWAVEQDSAHAQPKSPEENDY